MLIDFWTYTCINCIRTLPYLRAWDEKYRDDGLVIVGVHSPEFPFERDAGNVGDAIDQNGLRYPVVQDNELGTWNAFHNQYWPAKYLIDADGRIRFTHFGEGDYDTTEEAIRTLLAEARTSPTSAASAAPGASARPPASALPRPTSARHAPRGSSTDACRPARPTSASSATASSTGYRRTASPIRASGESPPRRRPAVEDARVDAHYRARRVFLVMGSPDRPRDVRVLLDGEPISDDLAGEDVRGGKVRVDEQRLYRLVDTGEAEEHVLSLEFPAGVSGYAYTFG